MSPSVRRSRLATSRIHAEEQAELERVRLGLGRESPIQVLEAVEEQAGIPVCIADFPSEVAGLYVRQAERAFVFINGNDAPVRQRFTLAHEYGHHVMGHTSRLETDARMWGKDLQEVEANQFAAAFIAPAPAVRDWADRHINLDSDVLDVAVRMGAFFGLSALAGAYRLSTVDHLLTAKEVKTIERQIAENEHFGRLSALGLTGFADSISRIRRDAEEGKALLPRLPATFVHQAHQAHDRGLLETSHLELLLRSTSIDPPEDELAR